MTLIEWVVVLAIIAVLLALLFPPATRSREATRQVQCKNKLKQIGLALHNYHDVYGSFPPAYTVDADGQPLHSWRTLILPYLDRDDVYESIDLTKRWDDPANATAFETRIPEFECPEDYRDIPHTNYLGLVGVHAAFHPNRPRQLSEFLDGPSKTVMVTDVLLKDAVHWMAPQDISIENFFRHSKDLDHLHEGGFQCLSADGAVHFVNEKIKAEDLRALVTPAGNDSLSFEF